jgi:hypothetical protein
MLIWNFPRYFSFTPFPASLVPGTYSLRSKLQDIMAFLLTLLLLVILHSKNYVSRKAKIPYNLEWSSSLLNHVYVTYFLRFIILVVLAFLDTFLLLRT